MGPQRLTRPCLGDHVVLELISRSAAIMLRILSPGLPSHFYCFLIWMRRMFHFFSASLRKKRGINTPIYRISAQTKRDLCLLSGPGHMVGEICAGPTIFTSETEVQGQQG